MLDPLAFKTLSYALAVLLALAALVRSLISLRIEIIYGKPFNGLFPTVLIIGAFCLLSLLFTAYVQYQRSASTMVRGAKDRTRKAPGAMEVRCDCPLRKRLK
jgi:hypothetical protein